MAQTNYSKPGYIELLSASGSPTGMILAEVTEARMEEQSNDKPVETLRKGLAGFSDGPEQCNVTFGQAIPRAGMEVAFHSVCRNHTYVRVGFVIANVRRIAEGRIMTVDDSTDVNTPNKRNVNFHGKVVAESTIPILG